MWLKRVTGPRRGTIYEARELAPQGRRISYGTPRSGKSGGTRFAPRNECLRLRRAGTKNWSTWTKAIVYEHFEDVTKEIEAAP